MKKLRLILAGIFLIMLAAGCNMPQRVTVVPTDTPEPTAEDIPEPTETPTPLPQREKIAFIPSDEVPGITQSITKALDSVCAGYDCLMIDNEDSVESDTDFVIFAKEPTALDSLIRRFPQTKFIVVSAPGTSYNDAWVIQYDEAFLPFLAGMALTENAYDWRSVGLIPSDSAVWGTHAEEAFLNGAHYMCGNCRSSLAPYVSFPLVISLPGSSASDMWNSRFDEAQKSTIYTAFLSDEALSEALLQKLVSLNIQMLGVSAPPAGLEANWLATINFDWGGTLLQVISRSLAGETQGIQPLVLSITPGELTESFSEGKSNTLRSAYSDLLSGRLSAYTPTNEYTE